MLSGHSSSCNGKPESDLSANLSVYFQIANKIGIFCDYLLASYEEEKLFSICV